MSSRTCAGLKLVAPLVLALIMVGCSREAADWKQAMLANTPEAYQLFLQQHPHGAEAVQARSRLQQLSAQRDWQIASSADTRQSYQQFLDQHPDSPWAQEARIRIENFSRTAAAGVPGGASTASSPGGQSAASAPNGAVASSGDPVVNTPTVNTSTASPAEANSPTVNTPGAQNPTETTPAARRSAHPLQTHHLARVQHSGASQLSRASRPSHASPTSRTVQLGAFRSRASAQREWHLLSARFSSLRTLQPRYVRVTGRSGTVYRLQVRLATAAAAQGLCTTLHRHAQACVRLAA